MTTKPDAAPVPDTADVRAPSDDAVEAWFLDHFHNVPGLTIELYNRFRAAADDLKARLRARESER